ncbi:MAG TPA: radical SAM protein [Chloroflexota bacterium]|nr:radical SAM protein [Chloroflexota bacterium]
MTRSCDLACRHCRAEAVPWRHPAELTTAQGARLLKELTEFIESPPAGGAADGPAPAGPPGGGVPHVVLTGGDPLKRPDVYDLAAYGVSLGLQVSITPAGTPALTREALLRLRDAGVKTIALSLDGSDAARHDRIRQVEGSFERTVRGARWAREAGLGLQINSLLCAETEDDLPALYDLACALDADRWSVFFLVTMGRGQMLGQISPEACERQLHWFYELAQRSPRPIVKTTEAHHFRRVALQRQRLERASGHAANGHGANGHAAIGHGANGYGANGHGAPHGGGDGQGGTASIRRGFGIRDGSGIMFISHTGDVYPSGFLPLPVGNVKGESPVALYRDSSLFRQLRDPDALKGKCGVCDYRSVCGGARSRAWAATGDPLAEDPLCVYQPIAHEKSGSAGREMGRFPQVAAASAS